MPKRYDVESASTLHWSIKQLAQGTKWKPHGWRWAAFHIETTTHHKERLVYLMCVSLSLSFLKKTFLLSADEKRHSIFPLIPSRSRTVGLTALTFSWRVQKQGGEVENEGGNNRQKKNPRKIKKRTWIFLTFFCFFVQREKKDTTHDAMR